MSVPKPSWFDEATVVISTAPTCGIDHDGRLLPKYDLETGRPLEVDGEPVEDNALLEDVEALLRGETTPTLFRVPATEVDLRTAVPTYYSRQFRDDLERRVQAEADLEGFDLRSIGELIEEGLLTVFEGHGSPSKNMRRGDVPYIKVSDIRAGLVNINPTNRIPRALAESYWRGPESGLRAFDVITPARASKNIGDFSVLMPGQEDVVLTREVLVVRASEKAVTLFDQFYLLWALTLNEVRNQWHRVVFMQTNREDVGKRYLEILIPVPPSREAADTVSRPFRDYCQKIAVARAELAEYLSRGGHHFFVGSASDPADDSGDTGTEDGELDEVVAGDNEDDWRDGA